MPADKNVTVIGPAPAGNATLIGLLVYKCGLGMTSLGELEKSGRRSYQEIPAFLKAKGVEATFYTRANYCTFVEDPKAASIVLLLCDSTSPAGEVVDYLEGNTLLTTMENETKLIVLVDQMEQPIWSADRFDAFVRTIDGYFQSVGRTDTRFVPLSTTRGDNILDRTEKWSLYSERLASGAQSAGGQTVVEAIDS